MNPIGKTATIAPVRVTPAQVKHDLDQRLGVVLLVLKQPDGIGHREHRVIGEGALGREQLECVITRRVKLVCRPDDIAGNGSNYSFHI